MAAEKKCKSRRDKGPFGIHLRKIHRWKVWAVEWKGRSIVECHWGTFHLPRATCMFHYFIGDWSRVDTHFSASQKWRVGLCELYVCSRQCIVKSHFHPAPVQMSRFCFVISIIRWRAQSFEISRLHWQFLGLYNAFGRFLNSSNDLWVRGELGECAFWRDELLREIGGNLLVMVVVGCEIKEDGVLRVFYNFLELIRNVKIFEFSKWNYFHVYRSWFWLVIWYFFCNRNLRYKSDFCVCNSFFDRYLNIERKFVS